MWKLRREICRNNRITEQESGGIKTDSEKGSASLDKVVEEEKIIYCHSNMPTGVQYVEGILEIKPSVLREYLNELERAYRRIH